MEEKYNEPMEQAEHIGIAEKMAEEIVSRFDAEQQNELLNRIKECVKESRMIAISRIQKELEYLKTHTEKL